MKKVLRTITYGLFLSFMFTAAGFSQYHFEKTESNGGLSPVFHQDEREGEWLRWDDGINFTAIGLNAPGWWTSAIRFDQTHLADYDGWAVKKVEFYQQDPTMTGDPTIKIWQAPDHAPPGGLTEYVSYAASDQLNTWQEIDLEEPYHLIDASEELVFGIEWNDIGDGFFPAGAAGSLTMGGYSDLVLIGQVTDPGVNWQYLGELGLMYDWNMAIFVEPSEETWEVTFEITDAETGDPIEEATITIDGETYDPGVYVFDFPAGTYEYLVEKSGYSDADGDFEVIDTEITVEVEMDPLPGVNVTFTVVCDHTGNPVAGANVNFDGEDYTTNVNGVAVVDGLLPGIYEYEITKDGYEPYDGEVEVEEDHIDIDITLMPIFYDLTLHAEPEDGGVVTGAGEYVVDQEVEIWAEANEGWFFTEWTGDIEHIIDPASAETIVTMPAADVDLTAHFAPTYTLTLVANPEEGGEVEGEGDYAEGEEAHVIATPAEHWLFINWTDEAGEEVSDEAEFHYTMPAADVTLTANFEFDPPLYTLTLNADPADGGDVDGAGEYEEGTEVTITATPEEEFIFVDWSGDTQHVDDEEAATATVTMPAADITLTANFLHISVKEIHAVEINVYPNPARTELNIQSSELISKIRMISISGQVIMNVDVGTLNHKLNVSNLRTGVYFMEIHTPEGVITERVQIAN